MSGRKRGGNDGRAPGGGGYTKSGKPRPGSGGNRRDRLEGKGPTPPAHMRTGHPDVRQGVPDGVRRSIVAAGPCCFPLPQRQPGKRVDDRVQPVAGVA